ncbi:PIN domain-containing protein [Candidatus Woesearchaeota archaeon]|nr:PIN domain-containing protein [Candidatus Woesearchaeota archaeon]
MKVVIDTNVLMAGIIADHTVREILLSKVHAFLLPEHAFSELRKHFLSIVKKSGLNIEEVEQLISTIANGLTIVAEHEIKAKWEEATAIMKEIDPLDIPFVAAALASNADGIWSFDKGFQKQKVVRIITTNELLG